MDTRDDRRQNFSGDDGTVRGAGHPARLGKRGKESAARRQKAFCISQESAAHTRTAGEAEKEQLAIGRSGAGANELMTKDMKESIASSWRLAAYSCYSHQNGQISCHRSRGVHWLQYCSLPDRARG